MKAASDALLGEFSSLVDGAGVQTDEIYEVRSPYDGGLVAQVHRAGADEVERAIAGAVVAFETTPRLASWQ